MIPVHIIKEMIPVHINDHLPDLVRAEPFEHGVERSFSLCSHLAVFTSIKFFVENSIHYALHIIENPQRKRNQMDVTSGHTGTQNSLRSSFTNAMIHRKSCHHRPIQHHLFHQHHHYHHHHYHLSGSQTEVLGLLLLHHHCLLSHPRCAIN